MAEEPVIEDKPRRYIRLDHEALERSEVWRARSAAEKGAALLHLLTTVASKGEIPEAWRRVAELRTVGQIGKPKARDKHWTPQLPYKEAWLEAWDKRKPEPYVWTEKDRGAVQTAYARTKGDVEAWKRRVERYFSLGPWCVDRASPSMVINKWNELVQATTGPQPSGPHPDRRFHPCSICGWQYTDHKRTACDGCGRDFR